MAKMPKPMPPKQGGKPFPPEKPGKPMKGGKKCSK